MGLLRHMSILESCDKPGLVHFYCRNSRKRTLSRTSSNHLVAVLSLSRDARPLLQPEPVHWDGVCGPAGRDADPSGPRHAGQHFRAAPFLPVLAKPFQGFTGLQLLVQYGRQHRSAVPQQDPGGERLRRPVWVGFQWAKVNGHVYISGMLDYCYFSTTDPILYRPKAQFDFKWANSMFNFVSNLKTLYLLLHRYCSCVDFDIGKISIFVRPVAKCFQTMVLVLLPKEFL